MSFTEYSLFKSYRMATDKRSWFWYQVNRARAKLARGIIKIARWVIPYGYCRGIFTPTSYTLNNEYLELYHKCAHLQQRLDKLEGREL